MRTFKTILRERLADPDFKCLYDEECHACGVTVKICAVLQNRDLTPEELAADLGEEPGALARLMDGDDCDPDLVCRIARHLGLSPPAACPRK